MSNSSRDKILSRIKKSMEEGRDYTFPLSNTDIPEFPIPDNLIDTFKKELEAVGGHVNIVGGEEELCKQLIELIKHKSLTNVFCLDSEIESLFENTQLKLNNNIDDFLTIEAALTRCEYLVSRTGGVVVSTAHQSGRRLNIFPPIHIILAKKSQLVAFPGDALCDLEKRYGDDFPSLVSFITGASRTADIEKTLIMGAHGPKEIHVFIDESI